MISSWVRPIRLNHIWVQRLKATLRTLPELVILVSMAIWKGKIGQQDVNVTFGYFVFHVIVMRDTRSPREAGSCIRSWWVSHLGYIIIWVATVATVAVL